MRRSPVTVTGNPEKIRVDTTERKYAGRESEGKK